jgi:hypothetical protein
MRSHSSIGMMAALAVAAGAGHGNAVEVIDRPRNNSPLAAPAPRPIKRRGKRRGKRLETRTAGGNWQGKQYLSYAEHDRCVRATFGAPHEAAKAARYAMQRRHIEANR